jgi:hypothetical protein
MKKYSNLLIAFVVLVAVVGGFFYFFLRRDAEPVATVFDFESCAAAGYPVMETYPEQCKTPAGQIFTRNLIGNASEKSDLIRLNYPLPGDVVSSPLLLTGEARGHWFFEATFPVELVDETGFVLAQTYVTAKDDWMTNDFVPFEAVIDFPVPAVQNGQLILRKDNPSGLPENDDALVVPVKF